MGQLPGIAQHTPFDIVLLAGHPGRRAIRGEHRWPEVVGNPAPGVFGIGTLTVLQHDGFRQGQAGSRDHQHLPPEIDSPYRSLHHRGRFTGERRSDEAGDIDLAAVRAHRKVTSIRTGGQRAGDGTRRGIQFQQLTRAFERKVGGASIRRKSQAMRLRRPRQIERGRHCEGVRIEQADRG